MKYYLIDSDQLAKLKMVATRLYREERLDGDQMRDLGHAITAVTRPASELEMPQPETWAITLLRSVVDVWKFRKPIELQLNLEPIVEEICKRLNLTEPR